MDINIVSEKIKKAVCLLYQNREQEGISAVAEILNVLQELVNNLSVETMESCGRFAVLMLRELLENYQNQDMIGMADCLMEKTLLFLQFLSE